MEWTGIAIFYFVCLALGFIFALLGAICGELSGGHVHMDFGGHHIELGGHDGFSHGVESGHEVGTAGEHGVHGPPGADQDMPGASILNTITICTFLAFFGLTGLVTVWVFEMAALQSVALSLPISLLIAAVQFLVWVKVFVKAQASSEATMFDILGCEAEVTASIPGDRVGQITYVIKGSRFTAPAVSSDGQEIPRCTRVQVVNVRGTTLVVRPL